METARAEQARGLYVHCTTKTNVDDLYCDDEVRDVMKSVKVTR